MTYQLNKEQIKQTLIKIYNLKAKARTMDEYLKLYNTELSLKRQLMTLVVNNDRAKVIPFIRSKLS